MTPGAATASGLPIVVVEDYALLCQQIVVHLQREGHDVHGVGCAAELDELLARFEPRVLVLDRLLPDEDGLSIAARLRRTHPTLGIVMLSVRSESAEREQGYAHGADIYLPKPMQPSELSAAIGALRRRLDDDDAEPAQRWRLDTTTRLLALPNGRQIPLTSFELEALDSMADAPSQRLSHDTLGAALESEGVTLPRESLEVRFSRLRAKVASAGVTEPLVRSVRGWGYQLCAKVVRGSVAPEPRRR